ncbi:hypothetical protein ACHQM5_016776 [Ranunculus cassubicifolius]
MSTMVVETVYPGLGDDRSTVSTRLFLPAIKVKEKAMKLRSALPGDMLSSTTSRNILAMTFRQVVLQQIRSFELQLFGPGAKRNMEDLGNPREVAPISTLSSSDEQVLSVLAEAVCTYALESIKLDFQAGTYGRNSKGFFSWVQKTRRTASKDFSVTIYEMPRDEFVKNAKSFFAKFSGTEVSSPTDIKKKYQRWMSSTYSKLEEIGGQEFITWASEYVPAYKLQVDANKLKNVKFEGWKQSPENRWEVLLTHSQMIELADILDMYYEDIYTIPSKQLSCGVISDITKLSKNKNSTSLWIKLVVGCLFVVSISILAQVFRSRFYGVKKAPEEHFSVPSSVTERYHVLVADVSEMENLCVMIVEKIKNGVGWPGGIESDAKHGAWSGELPNYFRKLHDGDMLEELSRRGLDINTISNADVSSPVDTSSTLVLPSVQPDMKTSAQDIASYQVVLTKDGKVVGFQPTSCVAVNHWASNPLANELYNSRKLTPGIIEPGLKLPKPDEIILIELLMSVNPESWFAFARPLKGSH